MNFVNSFVPETADGVYITEIPEGLSALNTPGCAAAIWHRTPLPRFQSWIDALAPEQLPTVRIVLRPDRVRAALMALVQHGGTPDSTERPMLVDDAAALAGSFADVTHAPYVRLRMDVVTGNAGQAFDMDATTARLICTYRGTGTQYGTARDGGEPDRVFTVPTGAPILLCGKAWPATRRSGLLHRSPSIAGTDETRLVLVIDPIADLESEPDPKHTTVHETKEKFLMRTRAAIAWEPNRPLEIEEIDLEGPKDGEVLVRIVTTSLCHTDVFTLSGDDPEGLFPCVLGHEGCGVVEEVGKGVTSVKPGDHVIPLYVPEDPNCPYIKSGKTNLSQSIRKTQGAGLMPDGTSRFSYEGKQILHYMGTSTFSEYTVLPEIAVAKIAKEAPLSKASVMGCAVPTGMGAVRNAAKVEAGATVAVFGLGAVGMAVVQGAVMSGASRIIGIDINPSKFLLAKSLGATECVNPKDHDGPIQDVLIEMTDGGLDYTFEAVGNVGLMRAALESCHKGWGECTVIGVAGAGQEISTRPFQLVTGRVWRGTAFGGVLGRSELPGMVDEWLRGDFEVDPYITHHMTHGQINTAFDLLKAGESIRSVIHFQPGETLAVNSLPGVIVPE